MKFILGLFLIFTSLVGNSYIPSSKMILDKWSDVNSVGNIYFEQEIQIHWHGIVAHLKETWLVDNDGLMKVLVQGERDLKDKIQFEIHYSSGQRNKAPRWLQTISNSTTDFFEPLIFTKSPQKLMQFMITNGILNADVQNSKNFQKNANNTYTYQPEPFLRLGRTSGVVSYVLGPQPQNQEKAPGLWIEQDHFSLRKVRTLQKGEMNIERWGVFVRGIKLPKERTYMWDDKVASAKILETKTPQGQQRLLFAKSNELRSQDFDTLQLKPLVEEFYARFR